MKTKLTQLLLTASLGSMACILPAFGPVIGPAIGQEFDLVKVAVLKQENAQERIAYSGKLRMLSQRIPAAACHVITDTDAEFSRKTLISASNEFDQILNALEFGDESLSIVEPETNRKTLARIQKLRDAWEPLRNEALAVSDATGAPDRLNSIIDQSAQVFEAAAILAVEEVATYSNPNELVKADAFMIDLAGRQRMLTQRISKDACVLTTDLRSEEVLQSLQGSMQTFRASLEALRSGMPSMGIRRPPNAAISIGLDDVLTSWKEVEPILQEIVSDVNQSPESRAKKLHGLNVTMKKMDDVVKLYVSAVR